MRAGAGADRGLGRPRAGLLGLLGRPRVFLGRLGWGRAFLGQWGRPGAVGQWGRPRVFLGRWGRPRAGPTEGISGAAGLGPTEGIPGAWGRPRWGRPRGISRGGGADRGLGRPRVFLGWLGPTGLGPIEGISGLEPTEGVSGAATGRSRALRQRPTGGASPGSRSRVLRCGRLVRQGRPGGQGPTEGASFRGRLEGQALRAADFARSRKTVCQFTRSDAARGVVCRLRWDWPQA